LEITDNETGEKQFSEAAKRFDKYYTYLFKTVEEFAVRMVKI